MIAVGCGLGAGVLQVDRAVDVVDGHDLAGALAGRRVLHAATDLDVVLLAREPVAVQLRPLLGPDDPVELETGQRLVGFDPLRIGQVVLQVVVEPPRALVLPPMPGQELGQEPASLLHRGPVGIGHVSE